MQKENLIQINKKVLQDEVERQLEQSLDTLKEHLGNKKFSSRVKKAVKILTEDIGMKTKTTKTKTGSKIPKDTKQIEQKKKSKEERSTKKTKVAKASDAATALKPSKTSATKSKSNIKK